MSEPTPIAPLTEESLAHMEAVLDRYDVLSPVTCRRLIREIRRLRGELAVGKTLAAMQKYGIALDQMGGPFRELVKTRRRRAGR